MGRLNRFVVIVLGLLIWSTGFAAGPIDQEKQTEIPSVSNFSSSQSSPPDLSVKNSVSEKTGMQNLVVTNQTPSLIAVNSLHFDNAAKKTGVMQKMNLDSSRCAVIPAGDSCTVEIKTDEAVSRGNQLLHIDYSINGQQKNTVANVGLNITQLTFYEVVNNQQIPINGEFSINAAKSPQTFVMKNTGAFAWKGAIDWSWSGLSGVTIQNNKCRTLSPGQACTFQLVTDSSAEPGSNATLHVSGDTIGDSGLDNNAVVSGDIAIMLEEDPKHKLYPAYSAIKFENTTPYDAYIVSIAVSKNLRDESVKFCSKTDTDCFYKTDANCDAHGGTLPAGKSCLIWFKSLSNEKADLGAADGNVTITSFVDWTPTAQQLSAQGKLPDNIKLGVALKKQKRFNATYEQDLYAAGDFYGQVAKWDGSNWTTLGTGFSNGDGKQTSLTSLIYTGRLVAGGYFNSIDGSVANNIAAWDGQRWNPLITPKGGNGVECGNNSAMDSCVAALKIVDANKDVFDVGGGINRSVGLFSPGAILYTGNPIDGTGVFSGIFVSMGPDSVHGTVRAIESLKGKDGAEVSCIGGSFDVYVFGMWGGPKIISRNIAQHSSSDKLHFWHEFPFTPFDLPSGGFDDSVFALKAVGYDLYIGGMFKQYSEHKMTTVVNKIAKWDGNGGKGFSSLGNGFGNTVRALETFNNNLYAGGDFINSGTTTVNHIAKWDGNNWLPLGSGLNDSVKAMAVFNNDLYAGGNFTVAGGNAANRVAKWDGNSWSAIGDGLDGGSVNAITFGTNLMIFNP